MATSTARSGPAPDRLLLRVDGMSCAHCVATITTAVSTIPGVDAVTVDLASREVGVCGTAFAAAAVREAIEEAGFEVA